MTLLGHMLAEACLENVLLCGPLTGLSAAEGHLGPCCSKYDPWRPVQAWPGSLLEMQKSGSTPDLLNHHLSFSKLLGGVHIHTKV